ncbi:MAG: ABC transporter ATP-binding protein [Anaerolineales bacterium]|nr:ABC transporter ATP-binding protein [Anaerolineales bacterium]
MAEIVLQTLGLSKYYGGLIAVDHLSLEIYRGEIFGFLGPNGAGKTTSISMMCGLIKPDTGRVLIDGLPVENGSEEVRLRVGVCPQEAIFWNKLTCIEQLEFMGEMYGTPGRVARQRGMELLVTLGLETKAGVLAGRLSGGMKRRLNLALALIHDPEIIVLDEPEAGLDPQSRVMVREFIRSLAHIKTVILTTHNMDEAERLADRVAIIDQGKLLVADTPDVLKRRLGEGDVLEMEIIGDTSRAVEIVGAAAGKVVTSNGVLVVRSHDLLGRLSEIIEGLRSAGIGYQNLKVRTNTLEDVFIDLTGRSLRE